MKGKIQVPKVGVDATIEVDIKEVEEFLSTVTPDFVKDFGGILSDTVRHWRFRNEIKILKQARDLIKKNGLSTKALPLKVLVPLIEASSLEEDTRMQERWANLLANGLTLRVEIKPNYVEILKELSPAEALVMDKIFEVAILESDVDKRHRNQYSRQKIAEWLKLNDEQANLLVENLFRLNLCRMPGSTGMTFGENMRVAVSTTDLFELTVTGFDFVRACRE